MRDQPDRPGDARAPRPVRDGLSVGRVSVYPVVPQRLALGIQPESVGRRHLPVTYRSASRERPAAPNAPGVPGHYLPPYDASVALPAPDTRAHGGTRLMPDRPAATSVAV